MILIRHNTPNFNKTKGTDMTNFNKTIDTFLAEYKEGMIAYYAQIRKDARAYYDTERGTPGYYEAQEVFYNHTNRDTSLATEYSADSLLKIIDKDIALRKVRFVNTITKKLGTDIQSSELSIGVDGSVNGFVKGVDNSVSVYSILAGGYNIQKLHYRVLVRLI